MIFKLIENNKFIQYISLCVSLDDIKKGTFCDNIKTCINKNNIKPLCGILSVGHSNGYLETSLTIFIRKETDQKYNSIFLHEVLSTQRKKDMTLYMKSVKSYDYDKLDSLVSDGYTLPVRRSTPVGRQILDGYVMVNGRVGFRTGLFI